MKKKSIKDLTPSQWEWVKDQFMDYVSITAMADELGVDKSALWHRITKTNKWGVERDMMKAELFKQFSEAKKTNFIKMSEYSIKIISKSLEHLAKREEAPTTREAKDATVILEALDKIGRLDDGKPTEITEEKVVDFDEIHKIAALSPFKENKEEDEEIKRDDEEPSKH